ncbi:uncharacterized protein [Henckelia pumila]|uniref:uncharacterized protein n=1 Tax=Henckelia pumila TaxID=405737 RepID=UPI003C6DDCC5
MEPPKLRPGRGGRRGGRSGGGGGGRSGGAITFVNADKDGDMRHLAEKALRFYNDEESKSFRLVKVCKVNRMGLGYYGLTFKAHEDGSEECPVFRGVVRVVGAEKVMSCEIKEDDDEITLLPNNDDYVGSK